MAPRLQRRKLGAFALMASVVVLLGNSASCFAADATALVEAISEPTPGSDSHPNRPPATFFSINAVLAKLDRQRGRGPNVRVAALTPANLATDAPPAEKSAPEVGSEPFGLFTFRAPEGMLWHKWRGLEADIAKEQTILDRCRDQPASCPSHASQFLRLIEAVKSKSRRGPLYEANRAVKAAIRHFNDVAPHRGGDRWGAPPCPLS